MNCDCLIHPFQNDPGTSQSQRIMDDLLSGAAKIDARTMADLLNYFVQLSRHINYYDLEMNVSDWQPFFRKSTPFVLTSIIKFPLKNTKDNLNLYRTIFKSKPAPAALQLLSFSLFHRFINNINNWHIQLNESSLPISALLDNLIRIKLQSAVRQFIMLSNTASMHYGIRSIDFSKISANPVWGLDTDSLSATDKSFLLTGTGSHQHMLDLYSDLNTLVNVFSDVVTSLSSAAESNLEQSFIPLKEELQKKHPPHLALLFAFLNIFRQLQSNLNEYTRKHLDYFYKEILHFGSEGAVPDRANILFEIQDALKSYLLKKGVKVKDGKDDNKQDILFELGDDIVVNQARIGDKRTLFVNNRTAFAQTFVEGVYMAPVAEMADGVEKEFADDPKNFPTLGSKYSKYADPETRLLKTYPDARIGFVLASPVLLLQAGSTRTITLEIPCLLKDSICSGIRMFPGDNTKNCCNDNGNGENDPDLIPYPDFFTAGKFYDLISTAIKKSWYLISEDIIREALKKGISAKLAGQLRDLVLTEKEEPLCYCPIARRKLETILEEIDFTGLESQMTPEEWLIIEELIKPRHAFNFLFSGEEGWIEPSSVDYIEMDNTTSPAGEFLLKIGLTLNPDKGAVSFFNSEALGEDLGTSLPLLKVQLDDKIKLTKVDLEKLTDQKETGEDCCVQEKDCCLLRGEDGGDVSLYHFFRNVIVKNNESDIIKVEVCGLRKFIVQNDESVMDVNGPVYPFGSRPEILNFDMNNPPVAGSLTGPSFYIGSDEIFFKKWDCVRVNLKWKDRPADFKKYYDAYLQDGLDINKFKIKISVLEGGAWKSEPNQRKLFSNSNFWTAPPNHPPLAGLPDPPVCNPPAGSVDNAYQVFSEPLNAGTTFIMDQSLGTKLDKTTRNGFLKINLQDQDFLHKDYSFVLARQMMAFGRYPDLIDEAIYYTNGIPAVFDISIFFGNIGPQIITIATNVVNSAINGILNELITIISNKISAGVNTPLLNGLITELINLVGQIAAIAAIAPNVFLGGLDVTTLTAAQQSQINDKVKDFYVALFNLLNANLAGIEDDLKTVIKNKFNALLGAIDVGGIFTGLFGSKQVAIPKEPWTPILSNIFLDYTAKATLQDIDLIHLYPYQGTYKPEEISIQPALLPTHCDEGTLFLGLSNLIPGNNLNLLFQMAEATSDSESDKEMVFWHYLDSNIWKPLRPGFEVLDDATNNLTGSGIIKLALPANMTSENTIMTAGLHWIKATIPKNSRAVSETLGIHPHAIQVVFTNEEANNKLRLSKPLQAGSISKLEIADADVKSVIQPYESFGGLVPEIEQQFYVRVSETLRHKGRAIQSFDYERLVLQEFPQLFKVKCINHSLGLNAHEYINDFPYAGGYVLMVVIPDLNKLKAGNSFEPKAPVSLLEDINDFIRQRTSPFVRFRAMNPRYEQVDFCLKIKLQKNKDENFYKKQVREDIRTFLAPWAVGDYYKLTFGQCVYRSDIIRYLETRDYIDFIGDLRMAGKGEKPDLLPKVCPDTPRSILIAGDIEVCIIPQECEEWGDYYACSEQPVQPCDTRPEKISDYCKKRTIIFR